MEWIRLNNISELEEIKTLKGNSVIFKHSTRCSVSMMAKRRFEQDWDAIPVSTPLYFLDLIAHRELSSEIADFFSVQHESPQVLLIKDGKCILDASHGDISAEEIAETINS